MRLATTLALGLIVVACGGGYAPPAEGPPAIAEPASEDQTCSRDAECTLVQDCCGCARSGRRLAVRRDRVDQLSSSAPSDCSDARCIAGDSDHRSCTAERARCLGGRCVPAID